MKRGLVFLALVILLVSVKSFGQHNLDSKHVDSVSYSLYQNENWKSLSVFGRKSIKDNIDYFYLRMRTGIADFQLGKYAFAAKQFEKALGFNSGDVVAKNYLYQSYLLMGAQTKANRFSRKFSKKQKEKLGIKIKVVDAIDFYGGYMFSNNYAKNGELNLLDDESNFAEQLLIGDHKYFHLGLEFNISPTVSLRAETSFLDFEKRTRFQFLTNQFFLSSTTNLPQGGYINRFSERIEENEKIFDGFIRQNEIYLNAKIQLDKGWAFNVFSNLVFNSLNTININQISVVKNDTLRYNAMQDTYTFIQHEENDFQFIETDTSFVNWVAGFNIRKDFNFIKIDLSPSFSHLYDAHQFQIDLSTTYFPLGNNTFYGQTGLIYFSEVRRYLEIENRVLFYQMLGLKLSKRLWIEADFYSGNLNNVNLKQASVVYNLPEKLNYLAGVNLYIFVNEHLTISVLYDFADKSGFYYNRNESEESIRYFTSTYQTHSLIGGIKWKF